MSWDVSPAGGLTAVIWTDFIQTVIMIAGAIVLMIMGEFCIPAIHNDFISIYRLFTLRTWQNTDFPR